MEKKTKAATESGVLILVIAAILVAVNALGVFGVYKRIDTTKNEKFTPLQGEREPPPGRSSRTCRSTPT